MAVRIILELSFFGKFAGEFEGFKKVQSVISVSVRHNWKAFKTLKNNRKTAGPFSVETGVSVIDR